MKITKETLKQIIKEEASKSRSYQFEDIERMLPSGGIEEYRCSQHSIKSRQASVSDENHQKIKADYQKNLKDN